MNVWRQAWPGLSGSVPYRDTTLFQRRWRGVALAPVWRPRWILQQPANFTGA